MKKDKHITEVKFLIENDYDAEFDSEVFAYFPNDWYNHDNLLRTSYAHIGQHSACHIDYAKECKEATPEQYKDLKAELESIGYNLKICK